MKTDLSEIGITDIKTINKIIGGINIERLGNHPIKLTTEMMTNLFNSNH